MQLLGTSSLDTNEWLVVVGEVETTVSSLQNLQQQLLSVCEQVLKEGQWEEASHAVSSLAELVDRVRELDHMNAYLTWLGRIFTLRYISIMYR